MTSRASPPCPWTIHSDHLKIRVRLTPKARTDAIEGTTAFGDQPVLKARVRALPTGGAANRALEILCAKWLSVPKSSITIASGSKSRLKTVSITGDPTELAARIKARLEADQK